MALGMASRSLSAERWDVSAESRGRLLAPALADMAGTFVLAKCVILVRTLAASIGIDGLHTLEEVSGSPPPVAV